MAIRILLGGLSLGLALLLEQVHQQLDHQGEDEHQPAGGGQHVEQQHLLLAIHRGDEVVDDDGQQEGQGQGQGEDVHPHLGAPLADMVAAQQHADGAVHEADQDQAADHQQGGEAGFDAAQVRGDADRPVEHQPHEAGQDGNDIGVVSYLGHHVLMGGRASLATRTLAP